MAKINLNRRLNIFGDETGEFGFAKGSAKLYGVSLVFHEQSASIASELNTLNTRLSHLNFNSMIHMGDLVSGHEDFEGLEISERRKIYTQLYRFSTAIPAKYHSFFIDKKAFDANTTLEKCLENFLRELILSNLEYFQNFDEIKMYYDGGQKQLSKIIDKVFGELSGYERESNFDHTEKKLFQVADMLTYIDKLLYKYDNGIKFSNTEIGFFDYKTINRIKRELKGHRL
ncbi:hypothetical protein IJG27_02910 [Candidatus Saccharibacteria bacterium]|nr:hypothetical protein [Candidatus Saccharibacteria bacterium]MBQ6461121.1 hypothetical protein [Candidatus Saccharibacteria bacterium]